MSQVATRIEHDLLGDRAVPADAYYGIHTLRALENFRIKDTEIAIYPDLIVALASVKQAAARANAEIGVLEPRKAELIDRACQLIIDGRYHDQFVVGVMQGGAGTSTNMNANEVIANRALELMGFGTATMRTAIRTITSTVRNPPTTPTRRRCMSASRSATPN